MAPAIEEALERLALPAGSNPIVNLHEGVRYALGLDVEDEAQRGKRLRPALAVLTCEALGRPRQDALPFAVAMELMHNFFLTHDDIEDGDDMRHGRPAGWRQFGLAHGINIGDYLHARVFAVLLESTRTGTAPETVFRLLELVSDTLEHTVRGQALDINARDSESLTIDQYLEIVTEKTGHYLAAPILGGAILADADDALLESICEFGSALGPMYQIVDDLIDLTESKGRGERGADIREGKRSFLAAWALTHLPEAERRELLTILNRPREETLTSDITRAIELFEACDAREEAHRRIAELASRARAAADRLPEALAHLLRDLANYLESRRR
jgi:geranylgeranyl pyrophosphate synthase